MTTTEIQITAGAAYVDVLVPETATVFQVIGVGIRVSDVSELMARISLDGISPISSTDYYSSDVNGVAVTSDNIQLVKNMAGNAAAPVIPIMFNYYFSVGSAEIRPGLDGAGAAHDGTRWNRTLASGQVKVLGRMKFVRVYPSAGTFTAGTILAVSV